jgi:hypothetical protein
VRYALLRFISSPALLAEVVVLGPRPALPRLHVQLFRLT